jgi:hypothetical protein
MQKHPQFKRKCTYFLTGKCIYGDGCKKDHDLDLKKEFMTQVSNLEKMSVVPEKPKKAET